MKRKPQLKIGNFYEETYEFCKDKFVFYVNSVTDHGYTYSYFITSENKHAPDSIHDCGSYFWESLLGRGVCFNPDKIRKLSRKESIAAAKKLRNTRIRAKFGLGVHPLLIETEKWFAKSRKLSMK